MVMIDLELFKKIVKEARNRPDILDSYSPNQFKTKDRLVSLVKSITSPKQIIIFGGWYGSILIPAFKNADKITLIDKDIDVISIAKNRLFDHYKNVEFISDDIFNQFRDQYKKADLFINTSCEHMKSMREWGPAPKYKNPWPKRISGSYFAFTSNNMYDIEGHINCVSSIQEFKKQLPENANVLIEDEIEDDRGIRFILIGKYE